jgi:hypothetical protein
MTRHLSAIFSFIKKLIIFLVILLITFELVARLSMPFWPKQFKNIVLPKYNESLSGIYFYDYRWQLQILKPNFKGEMFYNNLTWSHQSNDFGFRSPWNILKADIVILGDSQVYGHGLNFEETIGFQLEKLTGLTVANLGAQGDYLPKEYVRLKHLGLFLKPKIVLLFSTGWQDLNDFRSSRPGQDYVNQLIDEKAPNYSKFNNILHYVSGFKDRRYNLVDRLTDYLLALKITNNILSLWQQMSKTSQSNTRMDDGQNLSPAEERGLDDLAELILVDAKNLCETNGAQLIVMCIPSIRHPDIYNEALKKVCYAHNIPFYPIDFQESQYQQYTYYKERDGHFNRFGAAYVAGLINTYLSGNNFLPKKNTNAILQNQGSVAP